MESTRLDQLSDFVVGLNGYHRGNLCVFVTLRQTVLIH